jgi:CheY-like chemotaxis protein
MSYSLHIQPLVIEDEIDPKTAYERIFRKIAADQPWAFLSIAPPCFAFSYEEAVRFLDSSKQFHVVILDLQLPERRGLPSSDIDLGIALLARCIARERFPIPAVLILSAHTGHTRQDQIQDQVRNSFFHGRMFAKGDLPFMEAQIRGACEEAYRYCGAGVHLRDAGEAEFPTLAPEEEDLLRRSILQLKGPVGVDLSWWSAEKVTTAAGSTQWTKVLLGRHILSQGHGASRPRFFKFFSSQYATQVYDSARQIEHKLPHIKIIAAITGHSRSLIVTEKVGEQDTRPISLAGFLSQKFADPERAVTPVVDQIVRQLDALGDRNPQCCQLKQLLFPAYSLEAIKQQWLRYKGEKQPADSSGLPAIDLLATLLSSEEIVQYDERTLTHGDLHLSNVAIDLYPGKENAHAYIFDSASTVGRAPAERDLASLEIAALLHQRIEKDNLLLLCKRLYGDGFTILGDGNGSLDYAAQNTLALIRQIRSVVASNLDQRIYSLMLFDYSMIQVGGLAFDMYHNKIHDPFLAPIIAASVASWYQRNYPQA